MKNKVFHEERLKPISLLHTRQRNWFIYILLASLSGFSTITFFSLEDKTYINDIALTFGVKQKQTKVSERHARVRGKKDEM